MQWGILLLFFAAHFLCQLISMNSTCAHNIFFPCYQKKKKEREKKAPQLASNQEALSWGGDFQPWMDGGYCIEYTVAPVVHILF